MHKKCPAGGAACYSGLSAPHYAAPCERPCARGEKEEEKESLVCTTGAVGLHDWGVGAKELLSSLGQRNDAKGTAKGGGMVAEAFLS